MTSVPHAIDELTRLPGRDRVAEVYTAERRHGGRLSGVLHLDLDGFESLNERLGRAVGDQVLVLVAERLRSVCRGNDVVGRVGADEFVIVLADVAGVDEVLTVGERLVSMMSTPFPVEGADVSVAASIGAAISGAGHDDLEWIMDQVTDALETAKTAGGGRLVMADDGEEMSEG